MKKIEYKITNRDQLFWLIIYLIAGVLVAHSHVNGFDWMILGKYFIYGSIPTLFIFICGERIEDNKNEQNNRNNNSESTHSN